MRYEEFRRRDAFSQAEILSLSYGNLIEDAPAQLRTRLPLPPMLMVDRILEVSGTSSRGRIVGERDVRLDDWFFQCHFLGDPVQPGCLGVDAIWQLLGFYCVWSGGLGTGRALGCGEVDFFGQIRPHDGVVRYEVKVARFQQLPSSGSAVAIGDGSVFVDDELIYTVKRAKVGVFRDIEYPDYPAHSQHARGGRMGR